MMSDNIFIKKLTDRNHYMKDDHQDESPIMSKKSASISTNNFKLQNIKTKRDFYKKALALDRKKGSNLELYLSHNRIPKI